METTQYLRRARQLVEGAIKIFENHQFNPYNIINNSENIIEDLDVVVEVIESDGRKRNLAIAYEEVRKSRELEGRLLT